MSENAQNQLKVVHEIVAYRYSDEESIMLVGEAEVTIEMLADGTDDTEIFTNLRSVRVDILSAYDPQELDVYPHVIASDEIKRRLEMAALDHFFHPPKVPVGLPKKIVEW
ncbi:MAG: hypothetical protein H7246_20985 [Phycisphaerae bacterium]|nr:hypothetical protein [Saprospiraceae bacterium]